MIIAINLSTPRRKIQDKIDSMIFEAKMKNIEISLNKKIFLSMLILLMLKDSNANAEEIVTGTKISGHIIDGLSTIGYPTIDLAYNLLRMKDGFKYLIK